jgi:glutathione S-transferase
MSRLVLYQPPGEGQLSYSPYCNKVRWALQLKHVPFDTVTTSAFAKHSRTGKLPVLVIDGERQHDSTEILRRLETLYPQPALLPDDPRLAAQAATLEDWADESLCTLLTYERARDPAARSRMVRGVLAFKRLPSVFAPLVRARLQRSGMHRYGHLVPLGAEVVRRQLIRHPDALEQMTDGRTWLVGGAPSIADIAVAACLHIAEIGRLAEIRALIAARRSTAAWFARFLDSIRAAERIGAEQRVDQRRVDTVLTPVQG